MRSRGWQVRRRCVVPAPLRGLALSAAALALLGCADEMHVKETVATSAVPSRPASAAAAPAEATTGAMAGMAGMMAAGGAEKPAGKGGETIPPAIPRKIIYNARVTLVVENAAKMGDRLAKLVEGSGGYVSETDQTSDTAARRTASWTVRIPVERFSTFFAEVNRLGEVQQSHIDSQDVTQEYVDIEARIANKQQEEKRLQRHLDESTGKLEDILVVEREISRVRGEIETMQGRIRYLASLSALSTVTITATEIHNYTPPVAPTFATQIARTFAGSVETLVELGKAIILACVALAPWLPVLFVAALPFLFWWRRQRSAPVAPVVLTRTGPGAT